MWRRLKPSHQRPLCSKFRSLDGETKQGATAARFSSTSVRETEDERRKERASARAIFLSLDSYLGSLSTSCPPPYLHTHKKKNTKEPFESGLNNERISLLKAAEVASRRNWTLVLPSYKDFHAVIAGDDSISTSSGFSPAVVLPFSHFYDERAFAAHAQSKGFRVVRSLPPNRFHACSKMMSLAAHWPQALTSSLLSGFSKEYGVVCLSAHAVWHAIQGYDLPDLDWSANSVHAAGLRPSELYERELERMVAAAAEKFGSGSSLSSSSSSSLSSSTASASATNSSPDFIAVHVRIEEDWKRVCAMGSDRRQSHWLAGDNKECLVGEAEIADSVVAREKERRGGGDEATLASSSSLSSPSSPKPGSLGDSRPLAFVMSAAPTSTMPRLCDPLSGALRCFTPDDVWLGPDPALLPFGRTKLVRSYVSFLFAKEKAAALFGNVHSTFSRELGNEMGARGKGVFYYNPDCADPGNCP